MPSLFLLIERTASSRLQIEHVARIAKITPTSGSSGFYFRIDNASPILEDCHIGDSICVNGACLTVTEFGQDYFDVNLANETLSRTNLGVSLSLASRLEPALISGTLGEGDLVNCERAMAGHTRFGGHMVQVSDSQFIVKLNMKRSCSDGL